MKATFEFEKSNDLNATVTITMRVENWRRVAEHLRKAEDSTYGPIDALLSPIYDLLTQADSAFHFLWPEDEVRLALSKEANPERAKQKEPTP